MVQHQNIRSKQSNLVPWIVVPSFHFDLSTLRVLTTFAIVTISIMTPSGVAAAKQLALVTGGNRGIGLEVCRQLVALSDRHNGSPYQVLLGSRDLEKGEKAWKELGSPAVVRPIQLDVTSETSIARAAKIIEQDYGGALDVLVNNAGINYDTHLTASTADLAYVQETLDTNLMGPWKCAQGFMPLLQRSSNPRIVNVSSGAGSLQGMTSAGTPAYSISKAALYALTIKLANEFPNMRINSVCPGWVATDMGGPGAPPVEGGGKSVMWAVTLDQTGPTGGNFRNGRRIEW